MVPTIKGPILEEEWNFDKLLGGHSEYEVSFCRLYEFGREVFDLDWFNEKRRISEMRQPEIMLKCMTLGAATRLYWFYNLNQYESQKEFVLDAPSVANPGWLKVPYLKLSKKFRAKVRKHCENLRADYEGYVDPSPLLFVGLTGRLIDLEIISFETMAQSDSVVLEKFKAFLKKRKQRMGRCQKSEGSSSPLRKMKADLRYLGALRLLREGTFKEAMSTTKDILKYPLYSHASGWSNANKKAQNLINQFESEIRPIKDLFASAP